MEPNEVINAMIKQIDKDVTNYVCGIIIDPGTDDCSTSDKCGSVYGFAIRINSDEQKKYIFDSAEAAGDLRDDANLNEWCEIENGYFPLYWGKDKYMGSRINAHTKDYKSTGTIQLNTKKYLVNQDIIFGVIQCLNYEEYEEKIRNKHRDILKTKSRDDE